MLSCNPKGQYRSESRAVKIKDVVIIIPPGYRYAPGKGFDSYVAYIVSNKNDTFAVEYGSRGIINSLFDYPPVAYFILDKKKIEKNFGKIDSGQVVYTYTPKEDNLEGVFLKNYYRYDTIHGIIVKTVQPKRIGDGITGMIAPVLPGGNSMSIYATNLDSATHVQALKMFQTLRYDTSK